MICDKTGYENYKKAVDAVIGMNKNRRYRYKAYKCQHCGFFHITTIGNDSLRKPIKGKKDYFPRETNHTMHMKIGKPKPVKDSMQRGESVSYGKLITAEQADFLKKLIANG
jgi:hypothetical protein